MSEGAIHELLADVQWLRTLARRLARDPDTADDLVQETCAIALQQKAPPRHWRSWLVGVLRTLVRSQRRAAAVEQRRFALLRGRGDDEAAAAGGDDSSTLVQRLEVQNLLATAVLQLEEPYRATVLLRYFEGEPPRRIAARHGVPVATVHSRLQRGVQQLRERLDRDAGGRARWLSLAVPFAWPRASAGTAAVNVFLRLVLASAVVLVGALAVWFVFASVPASTTPGAAANASLATAAPVVSSPSADAGDLVRAAAAPSSPELAAVSRHVVVGSVCDGDGRPVAGASITAVLASSPQTATADDLRAGIATSDADGSFRAELAAEAAFLVVQDARWSCLMVGAWRRDARVAPLVVVGPTLRLAGRVGSSDGHAVVGGRVVLELPDDFWARLPVRVDRASVSEPVAPVGDDGTFCFDRVPGIRGASLVATANGCAPARVPQPALDRDDLLLQIVPRATAERELRGVVFTRAGAPAADALVALGVASVRTDRDGRFALDPVLAGQATTLVAAQPGALPARLDAVDGRWPAAITLQLGAPTGELAGRVVDADGPVPGAFAWIDDPEALGAYGGDAVLLEYFLGGARLAMQAAGVDDPTSGPPTPERRLGTSLRHEPESSSAWAYARAASDGSFVLRGATARPYRVRAFDPTTGRFGVYDGVVAGAAADVVLAPGSPRRMRGRVESMAGEPLPAARLQQRFLLFRHRARTPAGTRETVCLVDGAAATTDADGGFLLDGIRLTDSMFVVVDDRVLPTRHDVTTRGSEVLVRVERRCAVEVALADATIADRIACRDAAGKAAWIARMHGAGMEAGTTLPLHEGRSGTFVVGERATMLLLLRGDTVVREVAIAPSPDRPIRIQ